VNEKKIYSMLSIAKKAGKVISGEDTVEKEIKAHKAELVIIATDSSENTKKKFFNICKFRNIKYIEFGVKELLGKYTGKSYRAVLCIKDRNFKDTILKIFNGGE
jgi:ribosomal protein L7Ae-like RNA K-turn-binding protein